MTDMQVGVMYVVTQSSECREFQVGDCIWLDKGGAIMNSVVGGWMPAEDVQAATRGMKIQPVEADQ